MRDEELRSIYDANAFGDGCLLDALRAIDREATARERSRCIEIVLCSQGKTLQEIADAMRGGK